MRQILLREPGNFVDLQVPAPACAPGHALIRMRRVGVCGSDYHAFAGVHPAYTFPRVIGHELAGEVVEIGENDRGIRPGDQCAVEPYMACKQCRPCRLKRYNCCESLRLLGLHADGGMQAYLSVPVELVHKSAKLSLDQLALIETLGVGANAVKRAGLEEGEEALVIGAGPIGLSVIQFALATGAAVRVVEKVEWRRQFAERFGATTMAERDGKLAEVVFDVTGAAASMEQSVYDVAPAGRLVFVGICKDKVAIDDPLLHKREITIHASRNSSYQFPRIIGMIEGGRIDTAPWITHRLNLVDVPRDFAALRTCSNLIKAVIEVQDTDA
ncbi:MAG: zinc-binding alcohol dehydrogenase family protein [Acidobacteria bacterium]|nr:zinc-binding alcohol dehydrogenase family protein [Acidobacteriota bacterium]